MGAIERHRFIKMDKDKESRLLGLNEYQDALNCRIGFVEEGRDGAVENVRGNLLIQAVPTAGTNEVIGSFEDESGGRIVYFMYNSLGNHTIFKFEDDQVTEIITGSFLNFDLAYPVTGIGVVGDLCYFTDGLNPQRVVNLTRDYTGAGFKDILLHKIPPRQVPLVSSIRETDSSRDINYIAGDNYQFAYRYVYNDNELSVFSPLSRTSPGLFDPTTNDKFHYVDIDFEFDTDLANAVKEIQLAFVKNNSGLYSLFATLPVTGASTYSYRFYGDTVTESVPETDSSKVTEPIPFLSKALCVQESKIFLNSDLEGYNVDDENTTFAISEGTQAGGLFGSQAKEAGLYSLGVIFYDERMRPTGVRKPTEYEVSFSQASSTSTGFDNGTFRPVLKVTIGGVPPIFAHYYQIARTKELSQIIYQQVPVNVLLYWSEDDESTALDRLFVADGKRFVKPQNWFESDGFKRVYLQVPRGVPFVPDTDTFVRVLSDVGVPVIEERVISLEGDFVVVAGTFGIGDIWTGVDTLWLVELYKKDLTRDNLYYETGEVQSILNPGTETRRYADDGSGNAINNEIFIRAGDTYAVAYNSSQPFTFRSILTFAGYNSLGYNTSATVQNLESPTSITTQTAQAELPQAFGYKGDVSGVDQEKTIYVLDYSKPGDSIGRPNAIIVNERQTKNNLTVRYSNTFVPNSRINGLSNFEVLNQEQLSIQYSPLVALVTVKDNIISVHERHSNTIYTGEGFIKSAEGADNALVQTSSVIGQVRELTGYGRLGTIHPQTIVQHEGIVYWYDAIHGAAVEYTNQGAFPISEVGLSNFFRNKSKLYRTGSQVVAGYDPRYDEYILTFKQNAQDQPEVSPETIAYNTKVKAWTSRYSFIPEYYAKVEDNMYSFLSAGLWRHNDNGVDYNKFYDQQYERRLTFYVNQNPNLTKVFTNIHLNAESIANGVANFNVAEVATEQGQESVIPAEEFELKEGVYRTFIFRDSSNDGNIKTGNPMRSQVLQVTLVNNRIDASVLYDAAVIYHQSHYSK